MLSARFIFCLFLSFCSGFLDPIPSGSRRLNRKKSYLEVFSFEIEIGFFFVVDWIL
jgi:hypothetical protein